MRRLAPGMVVVLAMLAGAPPAGADVLETLTVDPARRTPLTSFATLEKGQRYQLTATGTITAVGPEGAGSVNDALYCFDNIPASPTPYCQPPFLADNVRLRMSTDTPWLTIPRFTGRTPAYSPSHRYVIEFVAPSTGKLQAASYEAATNCTSCQTTYTGSFSLELATAGSAPTPTPRPTPTPAPKPTPEPITCSDDLARAAAINEVRVVSVRGGVEVRSGSGGRWCQTEVNAVLRQGDEISTDPEGEVVLAFADNRR